MKQHYVYVQWDSALNRSPNYRVINQTSTMVIGQSESAPILPPSPASFTDSG